MDQNELEPKVSTKPVMIVLVSLVLGALFDYLFYDKQPGVSFPIFIGAIVIATYSLAAYFRRPIQRATSLLVIPLLFFATMVAVRDSELLTFFNIVTTLALLLYLARTTAGKAIHWFVTADYITTFIKVPLQFLDEWRKAITNLLGFNGYFKGQRAAPVLKGLLMALPILIFFSVLFASADLVFQRLLTSLIFFDLPANFVWRLVLMGIVGSAFLGAFGYVVLREHGDSVAKKIDRTLLGLTETSVFLGLINTLFLVFIAIQATYLFGGEANIGRQGFTYAEYARQGFFELMAVSVLTLGLILVTERIVVRQGPQHSGAFKLLGSLLALQTMVIMVSSFMRLWLYESAFGYTVLRIYSHLFVILLAVIFCLLLAKIWAGLREHRFAFTSFLMSLLFLAGINVVSVDALIARKNIERYRATQDFDTIYAGRLSADAIPETIQAVDTLDEELQQSLAVELYQRLQELDSTTEHWQSANMARSRARALLEPRRALLKQHYDALLLEQG